MELFKCSCVFTYNRQTTELGSTVHIQGVFSEKLSDFIFSDALKAQFFFPFFKSLQKTKTVSQIVDQSVGQWMRDLIRASFGMSPSSPSEGPRWPEVAVTRAKSCLSIWPTAAWSHGPFIRQPWQRQQPGSHRRHPPVSRGSHTASLINNSNF